LSSEPREGNASKKMLKRVPGEPHHNTRGEEHSAEEKTGSQPADGRKK